MTKKSMSASPMDEKAPSGRFNEMVDKAKAFRQREAVEDKALANKKTASARSPLNQAVRKGIDKAVSRKRVSVK